MYIRASSLLDVRHQTVLKGQTLIINGDLIEEIRPTAEVRPGPGAKSTDLSCCTVLPSLIGAHTHLLMDYGLQNGFSEPNMILTVAQMSVAARALVGAKLGKEDRDAGTTTVRDLADSGHGGDAAFRAGIHEDSVEGPRMMVSTGALASIGGQFSAVSAHGQSLIDEKYEVVSGPEDARKAVRQAFHPCGDLQCRRASWPTRTRRSD